LKTPDEAMKLIENMVASDHAILHDRAYTPTKKSLLELKSKDALQAQNKLLANQIETLTKTLNKLQSCKLGDATFVARPMSQACAWLKMMLTKSTIWPIQNVKGSIKEGL